MTTFALAEWQDATPGTSRELTGVFLPPDQHDRKLLTRLDREGMVTVRELRAGLAVSTTSFVGSIKIGPLTIQINPKIGGRDFSALLGYALGLPNLELLPEHQIGLTAPAFQDLLVGRLTAEVTRLVSRGLFRHYRIREASLASPRGRILFDRLARNGPATSAVVPCRYFERDENVWANRVLLAGLRLAGRVALDPAIRARALRSAAPLMNHVDVVALNQSTLRALQRSTSRLTSAYEPAFALIRLLMAGHGISATAGPESIDLPGFLFDMNLLFQEALGRFLRDWLADAQVVEQHQLKEVFRYQPLFNPRQKRAPTPRPDFVMFRGGRVVAIADAKYRDLWERDLPSGMLYQLSVYALSHVECDTATILYPATDIAASESRIAVTDPVTGRIRAHVSLRPVNLSRFAELAGSPRTAANDRLRRDYAAHLTYGTLRPTSLAATSAS
jgi:5-methylcytosine-specific restriction enzyme subunit McrC